MPNRTSMQDIDRLVNMLKSDPGYDHGLELARRIVALLGASMSDTEAFLQDQKVIQHEGWFLKHPVLTSQRACVSLNVDPDAHVQAKLYCLGKDAKKSMRQRIMAAVHFTPNYEDAEFTRQQKLPIGIDFFLHPDGDAMTIALSNRGLVRVLTLEGHLTNTAKTILSNWSDMSGIFEQERLHSALWDSFQLQEVNKKFYKEIARFFTDLTQHLVSKNIFENDDAKQYTNRLIGRLLFVWFLRKKGVINESEKYFAVTTNSDTYYVEHLRKLFFATLNTPIDERKDQKTPYLNGGLFDESELDQNDAISFPTGYFANIFHFFDEYNFTTDESTPDFEQVAIDPEMLGRIFENLLAEQVDETKVNARKASGAFYTPREIVDYMCRESLRQYLYTQLDGKVLDHTIVVDKLIDTSEQEWANDESNQTKHLFEKRPADRDEVRRALERLKVLDPACGSGAFPMGMMQLLVRIFQRIDRKLDEYEVKLGIMQSTIYGVDINPMAADISRLRAWLSLVVDEVPEKLRNEPLPNLDFKFITANSLIPLAEGDSLDIFGENNLGDKLADLRDKYFRARSKESKQKLRQEYRSLTAQVGLSSSQRSKQLQSFDPFDSTKCAQFFDIDYMFGVNGFDIVIGNPPYIDYRKIDKSTKEIIADYKIAHHSKMINLYTYFFELGIKQLSISGILAYISPQQYLILDNCKGLRDIIRDIRLVSLSDFARAKVFSAATYTFVSLLQNSPPDESITYREFNNIYDLTNPLKKILLPQPIEEPVCVSEYRDILKKIDISTSVRLGDDSVADIFCASSATQKVTYKKVGSNIQFIEASQIHEGEIKYEDKYIDDYGGQSAQKQLNSDVIYTSRMTGRIRATYVQNNQSLGGKVNVIVPKNPDDGEYIEALLNSNLINFWYREKYKLQHMQGGALPINTSDLAKIPFVIPLESLIHTENDIRYNDQFIYKIYGISDEDQKVIESYQHK